MYEVYDEERNKYIIVPINKDISQKIDVEAKPGSYICNYAIQGFEEDIFVVHDVVESRIMGLYEVVPDLFTFLREDNKHIMDKIRKMIEVIEELQREE